MRAALVLFDWFPHGGLQRDCQRIGMSLVSSGAKVDAICMSWQGEVPDGIRPVVMPVKKGSKLARRRGFAAFLENHLATEGYDVVLGFNRLPGLDYYFAADTCFAWKAVHERNWFYRLAPRSRQYLEFERAVFGPASAARLFMLSPLQKEEYAACYPESAERMIDVPPGIDRDRMAGEDAGALRKSCRRELGISDDEFLVLQAGSGFPIKGVKRSLIALASLPTAQRDKTRLVIIGRDEPGRFKSLAGKLKIESCVTFLKSRDDLPRFFQAADLLLHPSHKESAGMVILEAIVAGLPVLTTASCGYAFHVRQADAGCVIENPFSQQHLNDSLLAMIRGNDRDRWRKNGIEYGKKGDFYAMPDRIAAMLMDFAKGNVHAG